jgi:hypothetical protein
VKLDQLPSLALLLRRELDDPYSIEQLRDPQMNLSVVRPLVDKFYELNDVSISKLSAFCSSKISHDQAVMCH